MGQTGHRSVLSKGEALSPLPGLITSRACDPQLALWALFFRRSAAGRRRLNG